MKKMILGMLVMLAAAAAYLHHLGFLDDTPHVAKSFLKPPPQRPVDHFFYGLQSGELLFSGYAIDAAGQDLLRELVSEQPRTNEKNPFIAAATCQLRYNITGHQLSPQTDAEGVVNVELTMVPIRELIAATVVSGIGNIMSSKKERNAAILESLTEKGCQGSAQSAQHKINVVNTIDGWKVSTASLEQIGLFRLIRKLAGLTAG